MYKIYNTITWVITRGGTIFLLLFKRIIARGCSSRLNSSMLFLIITVWRISLIPPEVDPALAPENKSTKNITVSSGDHAVKSATTNPVDVIVDTIWNNAHRNEDHTTQVHSK